MQTTQQQQPQHAKNADIVPLLDPEHDPGEAEYLHSQTDSVKSTDSPGKKGDKMKAVHYEGPFKISVKEIEMPKIQHPDDVIIKVTTAGTYYAHMQQAFPTAMIS